MLVSLGKIMYMRHRRSGRDIGTYTSMNIQEGSEREMKKIGRGKMEDEIRGEEMCKKSEGTCEGGGRKD